MLKRLALLTVTAAVAVVPVSAAEAGVPQNPQPIKDCVLKWIKPPNSGPTLPPGPDSFDVENQYADSGQDDGTVEFDDLTYNGC